MSRIKRQLGLSMIELLVALVISSLLILGITQIYIDNRRSYVFQQSQGENQEGSRYAMLVLQQELDKAGYRRLTDTPATEVFPSDSSLTGCTFAEGKAIAWNNTNSSLCIRYEPRNQTDRDCLGNTLADVPDEPDKEAPSIFFERLYVSNGSLMCATKTSAGELLTGVAGLRFEFGLETDASPRVLDRYVAQQAVSDGIVTVRYAALMRSSAAKVRDTVDDSPALAQWQALSGAPAPTITALKSADSGQIYQVSQSTVMLRNLMP